MSELIPQSKKKTASDKADTVHQRKGAAVLQDNRTSAVQAKASPNNTGLPNQLKAGIESLSGMSMDHVRVHYNSDKPAQLNAHAYAQGGDIHLASGQEKHLPHEAWHVVQQAQGRVRPTVQMKGTMINDHEGLEREADVMGGKAGGYDGGISESVLLPVPRVFKYGKLVQRNILHDSPDYKAKKGGLAGSVLVENIRGTPYDEGHNNPTSSVKVYGWDELKASGDTLGSGQGSTHYNAVRMHLWNGRLGGPGNDDRNLAPGPAFINSSMSAGPETDAKNAVKNHKTIWLSTEVDYNTSPAVKSDPSSFIPNKMTMQWGHMAMLSKGPAVGSPWVRSINPPDGAVTAATKDKYGKMSSIVDLDNSLVNASEKECLVAYEHVSNIALKKHILFKYDFIFYDMTTADKEVVLKGLTSVDVLGFKSFLKLDNCVDFYKVFLKQLTDPDLFLRLFSCLDQIDQVELIGHNGWSVLERINGSALKTKLAIENISVFRKLSGDDKMDIFNDMNRDQVKKLLGVRVDYNLLSQWVDRFGKHDVNSGMIELGKKISPVMFKKFHVEYKKRNKPPAVGVRASARKKMDLSN